MKGKKVILLTATYTSPDEKTGNPSYTGWVNEEKGVIAQADTLEELKQSLLTVYWVKHCHEHNKKKK